MFKWIRRIVLGVFAGGLALAGLYFASSWTGASSYLKSSGRLLGAAVKDSIPVEFEIQRARDLLEDLIPEMRANLRLVAAEEVEVANLEKEINSQRQSIVEEKGKLQTLRHTLGEQLASYRIGGREYQRGELVEELARRFEHLRTAEMLLAGKEDLLRNRRKSLEAAVQKLDKTRIARIELASQIEALEGQFRLMQAQASGSEFRLDDSKLAQTQRLIGELKKRLEVAQRVLAREARFIEAIPVETVNEETIVERVDAYFARKVAPAPAAAAPAAKVTIPFPSAREY
ncbi:MAG: hypothetical protein HY717_00530 [Planctomycetes bacterium]|nr:hypothetical protein [Planctomycetota bacterium]